MLFKLASVLLAVSGYAASQGSPIHFVGNATVFIPGGLTACGISNIPKTDFVAGIAKHTFDLFQPPGDSNPHDNTLCKRQITVSYGFTSINAEVVEECAGCTGDTDLILSPNAYQALTGDTIPGNVVVSWFLA